MSCDPQALTLQFSTEFFCENRTAEGVYNEVLTSMKHQSGANSQHDNSYPASQQASKPASQQVCKPASQQVSKPASQQASKSASQQDAVQQWSTPKEARGVWGARNDSDGGQREVSGLHSDRSPFPPQLPLLL